MLKKIISYGLLRKSFYTHQVISTIIFFFSLFIAIFIWFQSKDYYDNRTKENFENHVHDTLLHIEKQISKYENALLSGIAFFHGSNNVSRQKWHNYVTALQTKKYYPGFQGIGLSVMLSPEEVTSFVKKVRADDYAAFTLKPAGKRKQYSTILYLEPMNKRNIAAIGYDMFSNPIRRKAMESARDTGLPSVSGKVTLVQEIDSDVQSGFIMYLPLYKTIKEPKTVQARRDSLLGFVYSPFRMNDLMHVLVKDASMLNFKIYDNEEHLLYSSIKESSYTPKHHRIETFQIGGRQWSIHFSSTPAFDTRINDSYPLLLTLGGLFVYFSLLFIILALFYNRKKLKYKTSELELNRSWLNTLLESSIDGIFLMDMDSNLVECSPSVLESLGYDKEEGRYLNVSGWDAKFTPQELKEMISSIKDTPINFETIHKRKDGSLFDVEITAKRIHLGGIPYIYASSRDISERKKREVAFKKLSSRNKAILDSVPDIIMQIDTDKKYIWANNAGLDFFGSDVIGKDISYYFDKTQDDTCPAIDSVFKQNAKIIYLEKLHRRKDGEKRLLALWCRSIKDQHHQDNGILFAAQDITEHKKTEDALHKLSQAIEQSPNTVVITDLEGNIEYVNKAFSTTTGYSYTEAIGKNANLLQSGKTPLAEYETMWEHLREGKGWSGEFVNRRKDKTEYIEAVKASPIVNSDGTITHFMAIKEDITEQKHSQERIHYLANFDVLTGLPNRNKLEEQTKYALSTAKRKHLKVGMLFLDIDNFKNINDTLGHSIGDALLIELAKRFRSIMRTEDIVSRLGGDEFIFMMPHTDEKGIASVSRKLLNIISKPIIINQNELIVTASIGIAIYPTDGRDYETLSKNADIAMYRAKHDGRNNYCFFTEMMQERSIRNLELTNALHHALERNELYLVYQPQVSLETNCIIGAEALLRWNHPKLGNISPAEFIPLAEESGLILSIGEWVIRTAVQQAKSWLEYGLFPMIIAVNLSAVQFRHQRLPELITEILDDVGLPPEYLEIELTEAATMQNPINAYTVMDSLYERGIRMSIDDFGTGYSNLNYLKKFKVYKLKIDQSFIRDIYSDPDDKAIVNAIISMAHSLGLKTIAEGVETAEQLHYLQKQGCDEIQGHYYSTPLSDKEFKVFVKSKNQSKKLSQIIMQE